MRNKGEIARANFFIAGDKRLALAPNICALKCGHAALVAVTRKYPVTSFLFFYISKMSVILWHLNLDFHIHEKFWAK